MYKTTYDITSTENKPLSGQMGYLYLCDFELANAVNIPTNTLKCVLLIRNGVASAEPHVSQLAYNPKLMLIKLIKLMNQHRGPKNADQLNFI